jgi:hypothetical protein
MAGDAFGIENQADFQPIVIKRMRYPRADIVRLRVNVLIKAGNKPGRNEQRYSAHEEAPLLASVATARGGFIRGKPAVRAQASRANHSVNGLRPKRHNNSRILRNAPGEVSDVMKITSTHAARAALPKPGGALIASTRGEKLIQRRRFAWHDRR